MALQTDKQVALHATGGALGAEVVGLDLAKPLTAEQVRTMRQALLDHSVIFFRGQRVTEAEQVRFTSAFGDPVPHVREQPDRQIAEIFTISNVEENGKPIGALGNSELLFHSDLSYMPHPGTIATLYALEVPAQGGATQWCNCYAVYDALDRSLKQRIAGLRAVHRHPIETQNPTEPASHPIATTHPETGRKCLYVGPHLTRSVVGLDADQSRALLDELFAHALQPQFIWTHQWQVGDLVMWDNRCTMHRREPFPAEQRRIMKRTQVFSDAAPYE